MRVQSSQPARWSVNGWGLTFPSCDQCGEATQGWYWSCNESSGFLQLQTVNGGPPPVIAMPEIANVCEDLKAQRLKLRDHPPRRSAAPAVVGAEFPVFQPIARIEQREHEVTDELGEEAV